MAETRLKLQMGKTINIGQYESLRVDIGIEYDVPMGTFYDEIDHARDSMSDQLRELEKFMRLTHSERAMPP